MAVVISTGAGAVLFELLSRPGDVDPPTSGKFTPNGSSSKPISTEQLAAEAKEVADRLLERFPDIPEALALGGSTYYALGDKAAAGRCWEKCLEIDSHHAPAWQAMGEAAWEHGEYEKAARCLRRAIDADPERNHLLACILADSLMNSGKAEEAITAVEQSAEDGPLSPDGLLLLGHAYLQVGQYQKARDRFEETLVIDPRSSRAHFGLATVCSRLGEAEQSRMHREQYAKLKSEQRDETIRRRASLRGVDLADVRPLTVSCCLTAGTIHAAHGDDFQAEHLWLRAAALDPRHPEPRARLAALYTEQKRWEDAYRVRQGLDVGQPRLGER